MQKLRLVTVTGSRTNTLKHMLNHYKDIVDEMYVVVYEWESNTTYESVLEIVSQFPTAVILKRVTKEKFNWEFVTQLYNETKLLHPNDWWIVADDDEFHIYTKPIKEIIGECEKNDWNFITGGFIDRIGENGEFLPINNNTNIWKQFPLAGFFRFPMSGACPNKVCVMKGSVKLTSGQHYVDFGSGATSWGISHLNRYPIGRGEGLIQVHHFKWDETAIQRILDVANIGMNYAYSTEYQKMYDAIKSNNFKIDITNSEYVIQQMSDEIPNFNEYSNWLRLSKKIVRI